MKFREYYSQIEAIIKNCPIVTRFSIDFDEIDIYIGYLKGRLELIDDSVLYFIEYDDKGVHASATLDLNTIIDIIMDKIIS